jgi:LysM repeat protein
MQWKRWMALGLLALMIVALIPQHTQAAPQALAPQQAGNLITNPGFEGAFVAQDGKTSVGQGWTAWWIPRPAGSPDWSYNHPDFIASSPCGDVCDHRIHSGGNAQRIFQYFGTYVAGLYQQVAVTPGSDLHLTAFGQSWSSQTEQPQNVSNGGTSMHLRIGIDPWGGTNPYDSRIVWSGEADALDSWQQFSIYARAQAAQVTVFLYAAPDDARRKNETYWDDVSLEALSGDLAATAQASYPTATPLPATPLPPTPISVALGTNLLTDGGFEGPLYIPCTRADDFPWNHISCDGLDLRKVDGKRQYIRWDTVQVPVGWKGWWYPPNTNTGSSTFYSDHPNNCYAGAPEGCIAWHNPEFRDTKGVVQGPSRIHSGKNSQKYFTFWSVHEAGVMQTVAVPPGSVLRFSAWMHAWSSNEDGRGEDLSTYASSGQTSMHMKVGIDPCGGENPFSPNIVWGPEHDSYDQFGYYEVRATAQCDKVTVFTHSMPELAKKHNDVYVDDAELVIIDASGVVQPAPAAPQPAPVQSAPQQSASVVNSGPAPTALPRPDGAVVHIVEAGDTVYGLALQYDVPMDDILTLNGLTKDSLIRVGQELVISAPPPVTATPVSENNAPAPTATSLPATAIAVAEPSGKTQLCVRAYNDQNADGLLGRNEELVKDTLFRIADQSGKTIAAYTSDGMSEPHCFASLKPGEYMVSVEASPGTRPTSDERWSVLLGQGTTATVDFGSRASEKTTEPSSTGTDGVIGLVLAAAVLGGIGFMVYRQRRGNTGIS